MRTSYFMASALTLVLLPSVLLVRVHPFGNAGLYGIAHESRIPESPSMPSGVRTLLDMKCADCHSSNPRTPLYGHFAPISWLLERDILEARKEMNLSMWNSLTVDQQDTLKSKILQQTRSGRMPLLQYQFIHWSAHITGADLHLLTDWAHGSAPATPVSAPVQPGDAVRGQSVFEKRCTGCHSLTTDHEGPRLEGVFGRRVASVANFQYSGGLAQVGGTWDERSLDRWLTEPDSFAPNSNMDFRVPKPQERRDLIAYLAQLSAK